MKAIQTETLTAERLNQLRLSESIEDKMALARLFHHGVEKGATDSVQVDVNPKEAVSCYRQVIEKILPQHEHRTLKQLVVLEEACCSLIAIIKEAKKGVANPQSLIHSVHLLASRVKSHSSTDELLSFVYKDLLYSAVKPTDFVEAYRSLVSSSLLEESCHENRVVYMNKFKYVKTSKGCTPIHFVLRYWPDAGVHYDDVMKTIRCLRDNGVEIKLPDDERNSLYHILVKTIRGTILDDEKAIIGLIAELHGMLSQVVSINATDAKEDTILHIICASLLKRGVGIDKVLRIIEYLKRLGANSRAENSSGHSPLECVLNNWPAAFAQFEQLMKALYSELDLVHLSRTDADGKNLLTVFAADWVSLPVFRDDPVAILKKLFELVPSLDVNAYIQGKSSPPINTICRTWLAKGVPYKTVRAVIEFLMKKGAKLNLKDIHGNTAMLIIEKYWLQRRAASFEQFYNTLQYCVRFDYTRTPETHPDHVDSNGKRLHHLIFEEWGRSLSHDELKRICEGCFTVDEAFLRDLCEQESRPLEKTEIEVWKALERTYKRQALESVDKKKRTPVFSYFTFCDLTSDSKFCIGILEDFVRNGAKLDVEDAEGISLLHLAAEFSTATVFQYLLNKFRADRIIHFATNPDYDKSLFAYLARNKVEAAKILTVLARYLLVNMSLDHTKDPGKTLWSHLSKYLRTWLTKEAHKTFEVLIDNTVSARQLVCLGNYSGAMGYFTGAHSKIMLGDLGELTAENLLLIDSICRIEIPINMIRTIGMPVPFTADALAALGVLLRDTPNTREEAAKAMRQFVELTGATVLDCVVLARCFETGHLITRNAEQAFKFYSILHKMPDNIGGIIESCRVHALARIENLARNGLNAARIYMTLHSANNELDLADEWYSKVENPSEELRVHLGKRWLEAGGIARAIAAYDYLPARLVRLSELYSVIHAADDYCSLLLSGDASYQRQAVESLSKNFQSLCQDISSRVKILRIIATLVDDPDHDDEFVTYLLQTLGLEKLFSEDTGNPPGESLLPAYLSFFSKAVESFSAKDHSTDTVLVYVNIVVTSDYEKLKERLSAKQPTEVDNKWREAVRHFIRAVEEKYTPIPIDWMEGLFKDRISDLKNLCNILSAERARAKVLQ